MREAGYLAMSGQLLDATIVAAPKQRNTDGEKAGLVEMDETLTCSGTFIQPWVEP